MAPSSHHVSLPACTLPLGCGAIDGYNSGEGNACLLLSVVRKTNDTCEGLLCGVGGGRDDVAREEGNTSIALSFLMLTETACPAFLETSGLPLCACLGEWLVVLARDGGEAARR